MEISADMELQKWPLMRKENPVSSSKLFFLYGSTLEKFRWIYFKKKLWTSILKKKCLCVLHLLVVYTLRVRRIFHCSLTRSTFWLENTSKHRQSRLFRFFRGAEPDCWRPNQLQRWMTFSFRKAPKELFHGLFWRQK